MPLGYLEYIQNLLCLYHSWVKNVVPNAMANNVLKYRDINVTDRLKRQEDGIYL